MAVRPCAAWLVSSREGDAPLNRYFHQLVPAASIAAAHAIQAALREIRNVHLLVLARCKFTVEVRSGRHVANGDCTSLSGCAVAVRSVDKIEVEQDHLSRLDLDRLFVLKAQCSPVQLLVESELAGIDGAMIV